MCYHEIIIVVTGVLEEVDDVLVNVNIVDAEKAAKNVENKKKARKNPYDEVDEMDEFGNVSEALDSHIIMESI